MNKTLQNFWLDLLLFLLLGMDVAFVILTPREPAGIHPGFGWHAHIFISILLTLGCLVHTARHWRWFYAVLTGKARGKMKLIMGSLVIVLMLLADLSGHAVLASSPTNRLHRMSGYFALIGMSVHAVRRTRWMMLVAKKLLIGSGERKVVRSA